MNAAQSSFLFKQLPHSDFTHIRSSLSAAVRVPFHATGRNPAAADWFRPADFLSIVCLFTPRDPFEFTASFPSRKSSLT